MPFNGCPGSQTLDFRGDADAVNGSPPNAKPVSQLRQWPVQLHLVSPEAPYFAKADVLLAADCTAFAAGDFHATFLKGKALAIGCPKLDEGQESYVEKIASLISDAAINTLTVLVMQVPCCHGLLALAEQAVERAKRTIPLKRIILSLKGEILQEDWM